MASIADVVTKLRAALDGLPTPWRQSELTPTEHAQQGGSWTWSVEAVTSDRDLRMRRGETVWVSELRVRLTEPIRVPGKQASMLATYGREPSVVAALDAAGFASRVTSISRAPVDKFHLTTYTVQTTHTG